MDFNMAAIGKFLVHRLEALAVFSMLHAPYIRTAASLFSFTTPSSFLSKSFAHSTQIKWQSVGKQRQKSHRLHQ